MKKEELREIKKGEVGTGLLIENDGYMSLSATDGNKAIMEAARGMDSWHVPYPFIVDAVFQKYDIKNANGRVYPERVLKKQVKLYQQKIDEHRAYGECYKPDALVLSESGWVKLEDIKEGDVILTLNPETNEIEKKPVIRKVEYDFDGDMIHIHGRNIDDVVTPEHGYPIYDRNGKFREFKTAQEIMDSDNLKHFYIPKQGKWSEEGEQFFVLKGLTDPSANTLKLHPDCNEDRLIPMDVFMKFLGIYLAEGDFREKNNDVNIYQKKEEVCLLIEDMLIELGLPYTINTKKAGGKVFRINDPRLKAYVSKLGNCYTKFVPQEIKSQSKDMLRIFYDWFVLGDGRVRGDKRRKNKSLTDDVFSVSKQLILDLNEIQLKIGYSGNYHTEARDNDRLIEGRLIEGTNCSPLHFSLRSLTKGIYLDKRFMKVEKEHYNGKVMCVEVENHIWYVMCNGKCHWTKNCNHPTDSTINLSRVSHNIIELHWEGRTLVGKMEINTSEGFRRNGIVTTCGDEVANLLLNGYKIGVSSRGVGSVEEKLGQTVVGDDFELICWDVVSDPSTPNAYISAHGEEELATYIESDESKSDKSPIREMVGKINKILD